MLINIHYSEESSRQTLKAYPNHITTCYVFLFRIVFYLIRCGYLAVSEGLSSNARLSSEHVYRLVVPGTR